MIKITNNQPPIVLDRVSVAAQPHWAATSIGSVCGSASDQHRAAPYSSHTLNPVLSLHVNW